MCGDTNSKIRHHVIHLLTVTSFPLELLHLLRITTSDPSSSPAAISIQDDVTHTVRIRKEMMNESEQQQQQQQVPNQYALHLPEHHL